MKANFALPTPIVKKITIKIINCFEYYVIIAVMNTDPKPTRDTLKFFKKVP